VDQQPKWLRVANRLIRVWIGDRENMTRDEIRGTDDQTIFLLQRKETA
jgi:hypothetical protein